MSRTRCSRCDAEVSFDPAKAEDHIGHLFVWIAYCQGSGHRNYIVIDFETLDSVVVAMPSSIHSSFALENRDEPKPAAEERNNVRES